MEMTQTKQRIIGIVVLLALLAIIIPLLMNNDSDQSSLAELELTMPEQPEAPVMELVEAPEPPVELSVVTVEEDEVIVEDTKQEAKSVAKTETVTSKVVAQKAKPTEPVIITESQPKESPKIKITSPKPTAVTSGEAWTVQVGSFGNKNNVARLVSQLKNQGFNVYTKDVATANGQLTRVYVGPEVEQGNAQQNLKKIETQFKLKGKVVKYQL